MCSVNYNGKTVQLWSMITRDNRIVIYQNTIVNNRPESVEIDINTLTRNQVSKVIRETLSTKVDR